MNCSVQCTFAEHLYFLLLTSEKFEFHLMLDQKQLSSCHDLQNFKSSESGDVQRNFWSSGFFGTWSSESSSLQMLETFIRTSGLQNLQHLIRSTIFRGWDCSSELPVSESSEASWQIFRVC